jgi:hypothetical protein
MISNVCGAARAVPHRQLRVCMHAGRQATAVGPPGPRQPPNKRYRFPPQPPASATWPMRPRGGSFCSQPSRFCWSREAGFRGLQIWGTASSSSSSRHNMHSRHTGAGRQRAGREVSRTADRVPGRCGPGAGWTACWPPAVSQAWRRAATASRYAAAGGQAAPRYAGRRLLRRQLARCRLVLQGVAAAASAAPPAAAAARAIRHTGMHSKLSSPDRQPLH